ncbi:alpha/beta hydrolase [Mycobacterium sp. B14F4]|uniref:alpha/beta hydrolase n=1 Tax=Mycobacterium sp. B14F4 TaxID=3153565 RepID=UPI00325D574F
MSETLRWLSAGVVTAGLTAAMLAGAGVAAADDDSASGQSASSAESSTDSGDGETPAADPSAGEPDAGEAGDDPAEGLEDTPSTEPQEEPAEAEEPTEPAAEITAPPAEPSRSSDPSGPADDQTPFSAPESRLANSRVAVSTDARADAEPLAESAATAPSAPRDEPVLVDIEAAGADVVADALPVAETSFTSTPVVARAALAPTAAVSPLSSLISAVSTLIFNVYTLAARVLSGPPKLPPGSTVTVRSTSLYIDCGDGYTVPADWYIPAGAAEEPPERLIYLQHGFLGSGAWYSYTAANLAERTNSIVVATSITSNPLPCDGCALNGDPMRRAIADLFRDDNPALAASARRAGYRGELPQRVVLVGHSAGGGLAVETAGFMIDNGTVGKLAGVLMLDGVPSGDEIPDTLSRLPADIPVYNLAAEPYSWNRNGFANGQLVAARPGQFTGVQVVQGLHSDSVQGGNPLIQFAVYVATGFSKARNVEAVQTLAAGWVDDMFTGTQSMGLYGAPGSTITIPTGSGVASAIVLPAISPAVLAAAV